ncbi:unnamed protein product [Paramecium pentaurelia]|uniref:Uncharacterized protein n=1 Tax=Paramecium pentaurelia TaxID=43138 RepID=A0A8S1SY93_9CILI|nr:unnamed protein product [Paramecium pentaurelia]
MINEFLIDTYKWCGDEDKIIQGYILCDDQIFECQKYSQQFKGPATFQHQNFKILAARLDHFILVIIFSSKFLIDPSKCSFLISNNNQPLPFYPKQMSNEFDPLKNYKITLKNFLNTYNLREQIYFNTFERNLNTGSLIPILLCPKQVLQNVWEYFIEQNCYIDTLDEFQEALMSLQRQVKLGNSIIVQILIGVCDLFKNSIQIKPKLSKVDIEKQIMNQIYTILEIQKSQFKGQPLLIDQSDQFVQQLMILVQKIIYKFFKFIEETINLLIDNDFDPQELNYVLEEQIENQVSQLAIEMHKFALVEFEDFNILFEKIKEVIFFIHKDIEQFIVMTSIVVNDQLQKVNDLFDDYPALANIKTFQAIQTDVSQYLVRELQQYFLIEKSNFWRPEFANNFEFIKKILISYLEYKEEKINIPQKTTNFQTSLIRMAFDLKMPIQTIQIIVNKDDRDFIKEKDSLFIEKINIIKKGKLSAYKIYLHNKEQLVLYMMKHQIIIIQFDYFNQNLWTEVEQFSNLNMKLSQGVQHILEINIEYAKNIKLYEQENNVQNDDDYQGQSKLIVNFSMNMEEQMQVKIKQFCKKIDKKSQGAVYKPMNQKILTAGAIGTGIGIFLVDCLDKNISWQQKLQRAGYGSAETIAFTALSMHLPIISYLVASTFLLYSFHNTLSNKVLSIQNKFKIFGNFGVKTSIGVGSAIAGQILIPMPIVGAVVGSVVGGVGIGLYQKFIVPSTKNSLLGIIKRLEEFIQPNGQLKFGKKVIKKMRINYIHFFENKPVDLNFSDWLTLISVNLVNEVSYLYELQWEEQKKKLFEKEDNEKNKQKIIQLENREEKLEEKLWKWDICRDYIYKENISTLQYAKQIGIFVTGMICNFKF